jgi:hypothetical protein
LPTVARKLNDDTGSNTISPDEFLKAVSELDGLDTKLDEATAERRSIVGIIRGVRKRMKKAGADMGALDDALRLRKLDDPKAHMAQIAKYAAWLSLPLFTQAELALPEAEQMPSQDARDKFAVGVAESSGYNARLVGADTMERNPHQPGEELHQAWARGWHRADHDNKGAPPETVTTASTERRPRGRPPKATPAPIDTTGGGTAF